MDWGRAMEHFILYCMKQGNFHDNDALKILSIWSLFQVSLESILQKLNTCIYGMALTLLNFSVRSLRLINIYMLTVFRRFQRNNTLWQVENLEIKWDILFKKGLFERHVCRSRFCRARICTKHSENCYELLRTINNK